jgi:hypothetical protein
VPEPRRRQEVEASQFETLLLELRRIADALEEANRQPAFAVDLSALGDAVLDNLE